MVSSGRPAPYLCYRDEGGWILNLMTIVGFAEAQETMIK